MIDLNMVKKNSYKSTTWKYWESYEGSMEFFLHPSRGGFHYYFLIFALTYYIKFIVIIIIIIIYIYNSLNVCNWENIKYI